MNEIEKLYENAVVEKLRYCFAGCKYAFCNSCDDCNVADKMVYPQFTAEKQIELIKWLGKRGLLNIIYSKDKNTYHLFNDRCIGAFCYDIATAIATLVQCELDFCSPEEKQQIKEILE